MRNSPLRQQRPLSLSSPARAHCFDGAEGREAVHRCDLDLDFGGLAVRVSCGDALAKNLQVSLLRLDPTSGVASSPPLPECPTLLPRGAEGLGSGDCCRAILSSRSPVLADRYDRSCLAVDDGGTAAVRFMATIGVHGADLLTFGNLVQTLRQDRTVAVAAGGELHCEDVRRGPIHGQMHLAPPASALDALLARLPFADAKELGAGTVHQPVQQVIGKPAGDRDGERLVPPAGVVLSCTGLVDVCQLRQAGHHRGRLPKRQLGTAPWWSERIR